MQVLSRVKECVRKQQVRKVDCKKYFHNNLFERPPIINIIYLDFMYLINITDIKHHSINLITHRLMLIQTGPVKKY